MRPNRWCSRPSHLLAMCDNTSYNWAAAGLAPPVSSARYEYDYEARAAPIGGLWEAAGQSGKIMDMMVGWAGQAAVCAQLCSAPGWLRVYTTLSRWEEPSAGVLACLSRCVGSRVAPRSWPGLSLHYSYDMRSMCRTVVHTDSAHLCTHRAIWQLEAAPHQAAVIIDSTQTRKRWPGCYGQDTCTSCSKHLF